MIAVGGPSSFAEVLDRPFGLLKAHVGVLIRVPLALMVPGAAAVGAAQALAQNVMTAPESAGPFASMLALLVFYGITLGFLVVQMVASLAAYAGVRKALDGEPVTVGGSYREALRIRALGTTLLAAIIVGLGLLCCIAPGIILMIYFAFVIPIVLERGPGGADALSRSFVLVRYNPQRNFVRSTSLKVFLLFLVMTAIGYAFALLLGLPVIVVNMLTTFRAAAGGYADGFPAWWPIFGALQQVLFAAVRSVTMLYSAAAFTMFYRETRERMEGVALEKALEERIEASRVPASFPDLPAPGGGETADA